MNHLFTVEEKRIVVCSEGVTIRGNFNPFFLFNRQIKDLMLKWGVVFIEVDADTYKKYELWRRN